MKISAEGFDYDKKGDIEGLRYNVLLKFGYNKKTKSIFNIEICLKMKYSNISHLRQLNKNKVAESLDFTGVMPLFMFKRMLYGNTTLKFF